MFEKFKDFASKYVNTVAIILCAIVGAVIVGFFIYKQQELVARTQEIQKSVVQQKELSDGIMRSMSSYVEKKDFEEFAKQSNINLDAIKQDLDKLNAKPYIITYVQTSTPGTSQKDVPSTDTQVNPTPASEDKYGYLKNIQKLNLNERFPAPGNGTSDIPFGDVAFDASKKAPWAVNVYPRNYTNTMVIGKDENGKSYSYVRFAVDVNGKTYPVMVNTAKMVEEYPSAKFRFWDPRLFAGAQGGVNISQVNGELPIGASLGLMSYGQYSGSPDWSFLQFGGGYGVVSKKFMATFTPAAYNIGKHLPFMSNTYVASDVGVNTSGDISVSAGIKVGL